MGMIRTPDQRIDELPRYPLKPADLAPFIQEASYKIWLPKDRHESVETRFGDNAGTIVRFTLETKDGYLKHWFGGTEKFPPAWYRAMVPCKKNDPGGKIISESIEEGEYQSLSKLLDQ